MGFPAGAEWILILAVLLLFFGAKKLPELARSMGQASKEFRSGLKEGHKEQRLEGPCPFCETDVPADAKFCAGCGKSATDIISERERKAADKPV